MLCALPSEKASAAVLGGSEKTSTTFELAAIAAEPVGSAIGYSKSTSSRCVSMGREAR
ncbi:hypothetical protein D3C83_250100 [compost metagenome]